MSLTQNDMVMPVAPAYGGGNSGFGWGGDNGWWLILLFLFAFNGGWGGGFGNGGAMPYVVNNDVQRGFDQSAIMGGLNGLTAAVTSGFANAEIAKDTAVKYAIADTAGKYQRKIDEMQLKIDDMQTKQAEQLAILLQATGKDSKK